jgi:hypothetical protein
MVGFAPDSPLEEGTRLWKSEIPPASIRGSAARKWQQKRAINQSVMSQFPTHPNREFFAALQGI